MQKAWAVVRNGRERLVSTYEAYQPFVPAISFAAGVLFDILTIGRIDQWSNIVTLGVYLLAALGLLALEIVDLQAPIKVGERLAKLWPYREEAAHFVLGSLLSAFAIFFFKSSSFWGAAIFIFIIAVALVGNELSAVRRAGLGLRTALLALCLTSYFACIVPVFWGEVGPLPFLVALVVACAAFALFVFGVARLVPDKTALRRPVVYPFAGVTVVFLLFYFLRVIPPVPLSLTRIGIYRSVTKEAGSYVVTSIKPKWKFWQSGDQTFEYRSGERIYCFFSVFSPGGFRDQIKVRWIHKHPEKGWQPSDAVPVSIAGGRLQGYRGFAYKANVLPGEWQVRIETRDEREIGRISIDVVKDETNGPRRLNTERI